MDIQKIKEFLDSPTGKASLEKFANRIKIQSDREHKAWTYLESLSSDSFETLLSKFIIWETEFEEREYQNGKHKSSNIFTVVFDCIIKNCDQIDSDEMFFGGGVMYRGYSFKVFIGQGSFCNIEKDDKLIFATR